MVHERYYSKVLLWSSPLKGQFQGDKEHIGFKLGVGALHAIHTQNKFNEVVKKKKKTFPYQLPKKKNLNTKKPFPLKKIKRKYAQD